MTFAGNNPVRSEKDLRDQVKTIEQDRDTIASILALRTGTDIEQVRQDMLDGRIMTTDEAFEYGFVDEVQDAIFDPSQEIVQIIA